MDAETASKPRRGLSRWLLIAVSLLLVLLFVAAVIWRRDIIETTLDPKQPFQTYRPPPPPNYAERRAWALLPATPELIQPGDPPADVFFLHPTTFNGGRNWNGPIDNPQADRFLTHTILPNYAGPFARVGRLFAPRYRQASLFTQLSLKDDAREARQFAYGDVRAAFDFYLGHFNGGRPIVLVGVEQGGALAERLIGEALAQRPDLKQRLAAVYLIDTVVLRDDHEAGSVLPACARPGEPRCLMAWSDVYGGNRWEIRRTLERSQVWNAKGKLEDLAGRPVLCVNPVLGKETDEVAPIELNRGAVNASEIEWGARPAFLPREVTAQCVGGLLIVSRPRSPSLRLPGNWLDQLKEPGFNPFYADLEADAQARTAALLNLPGFPKPAPPIETGAGR